MHVECTVMCQRLTSRKQRKVRKACESRGLTIEILFRRDFERHAERWDLGGLARAAAVSDGDV